MEKSHLICIGEWLPTQYVDNFARSGLAFFLLLRCIEPTTPTDVLLCRNMVLGPLGPAPGPRRLAGSCQTLLIVLVFFVVVARLLRVMNFHNRDRQRGGSASSLLAWHDKAVLQGCYVVRVQRSPLIRSTGKRSFVNVYKLYWVISLAKIWTS